MSSDERQSAESAVEAETLTTTPVRVLSVVLKAFEESATAHGMHARIRDVVRLFSFEEAQTHLNAQPEMSNTDALRIAVGTVRPILRRHMTQHGMLLGTIDEVIRGMQRRVHHLATSGPEDEEGHPPYSTLP